MSDCVFCLIVEKKIPSQVVYEDEEIMAFKDINPEAPVHILIIPKKHISSIRDISGNDGALLLKIFETANKIAEEFKVADSGFRIVNNCGRDGGQSVEHLHFHVLGGRALQWPPG